MAASVLRPYVSEKTYWGGEGITGFFKATISFTMSMAIAMRGISIKIQNTIRTVLTFATNGISPAFDPDYDSLPLEFFRPMVHRIFAREPFGSHTTE